MPDLFAKHVRSVRTVHCMRLAYPWLSAVSIPTQDPTAMRTQAPPQAARIREISGRWQTVPTRRSYRSCAACSKVGSVACMMLASPAVCNSGDTPPVSSATLNLDLHACTSRVRLPATGSRPSLIKEDFIVAHLCAPSAVSQRPPPAANQCVRPHAFPSTRQGEGAGFTVRPPYSFCSFVVRCSQDALGASKWSRRRPCCSGL